MPSEEFWNERYRSGNTPWDYGGVPPEFPEFLQRHPEIETLLIPGCGNGHEVRAALDAGRNVTGIELSSEAARRARERLTGHGDAILTGDFFAYSFPPQSFDAIYERTFLCAIDPEMRRDYAQRMQYLLKPGGFLFGFFVFGEEPDPPPYPLRPGEDNELFAADFERLESLPSRAPPSFFEGMEQWRVWRKKASA